MSNENENIIAHLEDIDQVMCNTNAQMGNVVAHLGRIAFALEALVEQGKNKTPVTKEPVKKVNKKVKEPKEPKTLYWYHAESDSCGIAKDEDDLISICESDGLAEPCSKDVYDKCIKANEETLEESKTFTHDDLKQACLKAARADSKNRDKLKALLKTYGAVKAVDIPQDKLAEVIAKIEAGDF